MLLYLQSNGHKFSLISFATFLPSLLVSEYNVLLVRTSLEHSALNNSNESAMYSPVPEI